ncbi:MAG: hypothetical protein HC933_07010 [Pleurocapsa sp. SU_196_0]|nr:hypothetical protein [Pleurocapsa sp. SU_196_0]
MLSIKKLPAETAYLVLALTSSLLFGVVFAANTLYFAAVVKLSPLELVLVGYRARGRHRRLRGSHGRRRGCHLETLIGADRLRTRRMRVHARGVGAELRGDCDCRVHLGHRVYLHEWSDASVAVRRDR